MLDKSKGKRKGDWHTSLRDVRTKHLLEARDFMIGEMQSCLDGICPEHIDAFAAAAVVFDRELRRRDSRRVPIDLSRFK